MNQIVLILNKSFSPIDISYSKRAIILLFLNKAKILDSITYNLYSWSEWQKLEFSYYKKIKTSNGYVMIPEIIILNNFDKIKKRKFNANKKNIFKRDQGECQYCSIKLTYCQATIDHINPRSKNGKMSWENCVISCKKCNLKKSNLSLEDAGMKLKNTPKAPASNIFYLFQNEMPNSWKIFLDKQKNKNIY